jgi:hypothetical protein
MRGYVRVDVCPMSGCREGEDIRIRAQLSDVRCKAGISANVCNSPNTADGPDYSGELAGNATIRITDELNGPNGNEAATMIDIPFPITVPCGNTSDTSQGGACSVDTAMNAVQPLIPGTALPKAVVELTQLQVADGGADGVARTQGNTLFAIQGFFIP